MTLKKIAAWFAGKGDKKNPCDTVVVTLNKSTVGEPYYYEFSVTDINGMVTCHRCAPSERAKETIRGMFFPTYSYSGVVLPDIEFGRQYKLSVADSRNLWDAIINDGGQQLSYETPVREYTTGSLVE